MSSVRLALVGALVVITFLAAQVAGMAAASNDQKTQTQGAQLAIAAAARAFDATAQRVVADGTPSELVDPLAAKEKAVLAVPTPRASFFVDQDEINALKARAAAISELASQVDAAETQTEVALHQQLVDALQALRTALTPAGSAGVDTTSYTKFADDTTTANQTLSTPIATQQLIDSVKAKTVALRADTAQHVAATKALAAAKNDAHNALAAAQAALAQAKAIPVLKVDANASSIAADAAKLATVSALADFQSLAADLWSQSAALNKLLTTRQAAFNLLATTKDHIARAAAKSQDVSAEQAALAPLEQQLNAAGDLATLVSLTNQIQAIKNSVDVKFWRAIYGSGKVIVVSIAQEEMMALQDGVVVLDSLVTTGRPSMPMVTGAFQILNKHSPYCMSSWQGNPYPWAGCAKMNWAMEFESSGYFLHDAPWRYTYGPGTDTEANGTHGCVNVPHDQMSWLYPWTDVGTPVIIITGQFGS
jgi:lipoprotein-anchoring transpeptidase ErfK/SrfK